MIIFAVYIIGWPALISFDADAVPSVLYLWPFFVRPLLYFFRGKGNIIILVPRQESLSDNYLQSNTFSWLLYEVDGTGMWLGGDSSLLYVSAQHLIHNTDFGICIFIQDCWRMYTSRGPWSSAQTLSDADMTSSNRLTSRSTAPWQWL